MKYKAKDLIKELSVKFLSRIVKEFKGKQFLGFKEIAPENLSRT